MKLAGWIAFYNNDRLEIPREDITGGIYEAKLHAIKWWRVPKSKQGLLAIAPAYEEVSDGSIKTHQ